MRICIIYTNTRIDIIFIARPKHVIFNRTFVILIIINREETCAQYRFIVKLIDFNFERAYNELLNLSRIKINVEKIHNINKQTMNIIVAVTMCI